MAILLAKKIWKEELKDGIIESGRAIKNNVRININPDVTHINISNFKSPSISIPTRSLCNTVPVKPRRSRLNPAVQNAKIKAPESVVVYNKEGEEVSIIARKKKGA